MPMGGLGSRFSDAGFTTPKPMIQVDGMPMFKKAISSLDSLKVNKDIIFVIRKEHVDNQGLDQLILQVVPDAKIIVIPKLTKGAAETAFAAKDVLNPESGLVIMDCDLWFSSKSYNEMLIKSLLDEIDIDGGLLTFYSQNPRYSYAKIDQKNYVTQTAEKVIISDHAITGAYYFSRAKYFVRATEELLSQPLDENMKEYYISYLYNIILKSGGKVLATFADEYNSFGTPEELELYKTKEPSQGIE